jgi:uncharacterized protein (DUF1697 family)
MIQVALLRGINVGGHRPVAMARLKAVFESLGCTSVRTYINSGNVILDDDRNPATLRTMIEDAIASEFGFEVDVVLRDLPSLVSVIDAMPAFWQDDATARCHVLFLREAVDGPGVLERLPIRPGIDEVTYVPGAVLWRVERDKLQQSGMAKLNSGKLSQQFTARNCNTVRKLVDVMRPT